MLETPWVSTPRRSDMTSPSAPSSASSLGQPIFSKMAWTVLRSAPSGTTTTSSGAGWNRSSMTHSFRLCGLPRTVGRPLPRPRPRGCPGRTGDTRSPSSSTRRQYITSPHLPHRTPPAPATAARGGRRSVAHHPPPVATPQPSPHMAVAPATRHRPIARTPQTPYHTSNTPTLGDPCPTDTSPAATPQPSPAWPSHQRPQPNNQSEKQPPILPPFRPLPASPFRDKK